MSFKRDGDDYSQLNLLKKRRVSDLLAEDIPEDEAFLMRSGRYACTVCHHRPVFDTIATLLVHRNGKKHLSGLKSYYAKRRDLMREVEKRKQILYLKNEEDGGRSRNKVEDAAPLLTKTRKATHHALLKAAPYKAYGRAVTAEQDTNSSCGRKSESLEKGGSFFNRLFRNSRLQDSSDSAHTKMPSATQSCVLPGNRDRTSNSQSQAAVSVSSSHNAPVNTQFDSGSSDCQHDDASPTNNSPDQNLRTTVIPLTVTEKRQPVPFQLQPYVSKNRRSRRVQVPKPNDSRQNTPKVPAPIEPNLNVTNEPSTRESNPTEKDSMNAARIVTPDDEDCVKRTDPTPPRKLHLTNRKSKKHSHRLEKPIRISEDHKMKDKERFLKLTSSGWKSDWNGGWIRDDSVEFDSDEDEPPL